MITSKTSKSTAAMFVALVIGFAFPVEASPAKKKAAPKRHAISKPVNVNMACEGTVATIVNTAFTSPSRNESSISFLVSVNAASGVATIMRVSGARMIKAGRYAIVPISNGFDVGMSWIDNNDQSQNLILTFTPSGEFSGETQSSQANNVGAEIVRSFLGSEYSPLMNVSIRHRIDGSCWQQQNC